MYNGTVKFYNPHKGFGFISLNNGKDVFVHHTQIDQKGYRLLYEGQKVKCDLESRPGDDRLRAVNVIVVDDYDWKKRYPYCPICNGDGTVNNNECHPCQGRGVMDMHGVYARMLAAEATAERRYQREQEWKKKYRRIKKIWGWVSGNTCSSSCKRSRKKKDKQIQKMGHTIQYQRNILDEAGVDYKKIPVIKRGSFKAISELTSYLDEDNDVEENL